MRASPGERDETVVIAVFVSGSAVVPLGHLKRDRWRWRTKILGIFFRMKKEEELKTAIVVLFFFVFSSINLGVILTTSKKGRLS